jgi:hypothetical protein
VERQTVDRNALNGNFAGTVLSPEDENWDQARAAWNLVANHNPAAVAYAEDADDVAAAVNFAPRPRLHGVASRGAAGGDRRVHRDGRAGFRLRERVRCRTSTPSTWFAASAPR